MWETWGRGMMVGGTLRMPRKGRREARGRAGQQERVEQAGASQGLEGGAEEGLRWPGSRRVFEVRGQKRGRISSLRDQPGSWSLSPERMVAGTRSRPDRGLCRGCEGEGQGWPRAGFSAISGVSPRPGSLCPGGVSFCTPGGLPGPDRGSAGSAGARRGGGPGVLAARAPHRALLGHHLVQPPGDPRNLLLLAHHCLRGSAPSARRASLSLPAQAPAKAVAAARTRRSRRSPAAGGRPSVQTPSPAPAALRPGTCSSRSLPSDALPPRPGPHLPGACGRAQLLGNGSLDAGSLEACGAERLSVPQALARPGSRWRALRCCVGLGSACWLHRGPRSLPPDPPPGSGRGPDCAELAKACPPLHPL